MKKLAMLTAVFVLLVAIPIPAFAAEQKVVLAIEGMTCSL